MRDPADTQPDYRRIVEGLGGSVETGKCLCPAHDDHNPSLRVTVDQSGKVLFYCHAGCSQSDVLEALKERGLWPDAERTRAWPSADHDLRRQQRAAREQDEEKFLRAHAVLRAALRHKADHDDGNQALLKYLRGRGIEKVPRQALYLPKREATHLCERYPELGFPSYPAMVLPIIGVDGLLIGAHATFLTPDAAGNLRGKDDRSIRRICGSKKGGYLPVGRVPRPDQPMIIAEGAETAMSAAQLTGHPAVAAIDAGNLENFVPPPCAEIIVAADNDEAGRTAAEEFAKRWATDSRRVRIALPPDGHNDWNDALRDRDADEGALGRMLAEAPLSAPRRVASLGMQAFLRMEFPPRQYLLKPWLTTTGLAMIDAEPGHGKTWLGLSIAYSVAAERPLLRWSCERQGRVLYVDGELPGELLQRRIEQLGSALPESAFRLLTHAQFMARGESMLDLGTPEGRDALDAEIERHEIELIILDSVTTLVRTGEDNYAESWRLIQDWSLKHRARGRAVVYLHHHGRSGRPRGTSVREVVLDSRIKLSRDEGLTTDAETAFKLEFPKAREFFGADAAPLMAYLSTADGTVRWRHEAVKAEGSHDRVRELMAQGYAQTEIAEQLGLSKGRVSQIASKIAKGLKTDTPADREPAPRPTEEV